MAGDEKRRKQQRRSDATRITLRYPEYQFKPEEILDFVELPPFTRRWERLGLNDEDDLLALQLAIMADPKRSPVMRGTRGLRKLRFAPLHWNIGKSGGARVLYVYFEQLGVVVLCMVYGKNEIGDISEAAKARLNKHIAETENDLRRRGGIG